MMTGPTIWICELCGEVIFANGELNRCPACGAFNSYLNVPDGRENILGRTQTPTFDQAEGARLAVQQEIDTAELYSRVAANAEKPFLKATFRALQRIEKRHAGLIAAAFKVKRVKPLINAILSGKSQSELLTW